MNKLRKRPFMLAAGLAIFGLVCVLGYKMFEHSSRLEFIPPALKVSKVLYAKEEVYGIGPGGNEKGVLVFELPAEIALEIKAGGLEYLKKLSLNPNFNTDGVNRARYSNWSQTPSASETFIDTGSGGKTLSPSPQQSILSYLNKTFVPISLDVAMQTEIDAAISTPGSFLGFARSGVLIIMPNQKKVVYAWAK